MGISGPLAGTAPPLPRARGNAHPRAPRNESDNRSIIQPESHRNEAGYTVAQRGLSRAAICRPRVFVISRRVIFKTFENQHHARCIKARIKRQREAGILYRIRDLIDQYLRLPNSNRDCVSISLNCFSVERQGISIWRRNINLAAPRPAYFIHATPCKIVTRQFIRVAQRDKVMTCGKCNPLNKTRLA